MAVQQIKHQKVKKFKPSVKTFSCKNCGYTVEIKIIGQTLNVTCPACNSIIDANDPDFKILQKGLNAKQYTPDIPLNSRGKLNGVLWEVIGFLVKKDSIYYWREYLLFNPYKGYRWIVDNDGHFSIFKRIHSVPSYNNNFSGEKVNYRGQSFKLFNRGSANVVYVEGEFFWRVKRGDVTSVEDFILPPRGLSVERSTNEFTWTLGYHLEKEAIEKAFKLDSLSEPIGVGTLQPSPFKKNFQKAIWPLVFSLLLITIIHVFRYMTADKAVVYRSLITHEKTSLKGNQFKSGVFRLTGGTSNVKLSAWADVSNSWVYLDALLVDANTQKGIPIGLEVSYYRGSDWSEGSRNNSKYAFNVPDGEYYLNIKTQSGGRYQKTNNINIKLFRDAVVTWNLWIAYVLILIGPAFILLRRFNFEKKRWSNSDYSPYETE